jgi:hypothetical protein
VKETARLKDHPSFLDHLSAIGLPPQDAAELNLLVQTASPEACLGFCMRSPLLYVALMQKASCLPRPPSTSAPLDLREAWYRLGQQSACLSLETLLYLVPTRLPSQRTLGLLQGLQAIGSNLMQELGFQLGQGARSLLSLASLLFMHPDFDPNGTIRDEMHRLDPLTRHLHPHLRDSLKQLGQPAFQTDFSLQRLSDFLFLSIHMALRRDLETLDSAFFERLDLQTWQLNSLQEIAHV